MGVKTGIGAALTAFGMSPIGLPMMVGGILEDTAKDGPKPPKQSAADVDGAIARDRERRRLVAGSGSRSTQLSGKVGTALGASIGKTTLGGAR
jgi:hypothetical protein